MGKTIELYRTNAAVSKDAFDVLAFNICRLNEQKGYTSFLLCGCEPKVGTTSVAVELCVALAIAGHRLILIDGSLRKDRSFKRLNEEMNRGLADYITQDLDIDEIILNTNLPGLDYIPGGQINESSPIGLLNSDKMSQLLQQLNECYDFVIIDAPSVHTTVDPYIFSVKVNATILVAAMDGSKKKYLIDAKKQLEDSGANLIGVIENKVSIKEYKQYMKDYDYYNGKWFIVEVNK